MDVLRPLTLAADAYLWQSVPAQALALAEEAAPAALAVRAALAKTAEAPAFVWYHPGERRSWREPTLPPGHGREPWLPIKVAAGGALHPLFSALQMVPNAFNQHFGGPTPIASSLAGGLLGAGLGYGTGWLTEKLLGPDVLRPGRLRRAATVLGGLLGGTPGLYLGAVGMRDNAAQGRNPWSAWVEPNVLFGKASELREVEADLTYALPDPVADSFLKRAEDAGALFMPSIPVDAFNRVVWQDPTTPVAVRAATAGLVESAAQSRDGARMVSPFDVGRIAVGMGSGLVSGMLVGKALGALAGLTPDAQRTLQRTGMWAGALVNVVPRAFGL